MDSQAPASKRISGWELAPESREALLALYPPAYPDLVADHVTLDADQADPPLPPPVVAEVVGVADDGLGVQALVARLNETTDRPDGSTYHITWSLDRTSGREPIESNGVIRTKGWQAREPVPITLTPTVWES